MTVPVDMSSEQKNLMGVLSTRQAIYLGVGISVVYSYVPPLFAIVNLVAGWVAALIFCTISILPVAFIVGFFGFTKVSKYNMNRDYFMLIKLQKKTQYGKWRRGV
ncbi:PrgI family mobile element protein [Lysinibacillus sp. OL1]|uniref:PrgI family mobile element protein n=1 Tax=Lysinibacillus sp. OL1 TaxID=2517243 RepID=UPI001D11121C|nr:PrgI family protein [Lysinibacillus sp. OL1]